MMSALIKHTGAEKPVGYDADKLSDLARLCIGSRSLVDYCEKTGLSQSFVSRICNGKLVNAPTKRSLARFVGPENEHAENGITLDMLMLAAGYSPLLTDEPDITDKSDQTTENLSVSDAVPMFCTSQSPILPMNLLLNVLIEKGMEPKFTLDFKPGTFTIRSKEVGTIVGIPAFSVAKEEVGAIQLSVLQRIILALNESRQGRTLYFVITDSEEVYEKLIDILPKVDDVNMSILYTADYHGFSKQIFISSDNNEDELEDVNEKDMVHLV